MGYADPNDPLKELPPARYAFLDALIAQLDEDATDEERAEEERRELRGYAKNMRRLRHNCRERDAMVRVIGRHETNSPTATVSELADAVRDELRRLRATDL